MQVIADLERRITSALERIDHCVADLTFPTPLPSAVEANAFLPESDFAKLSEALDEERLLTAQLNERLRLMTEKHAKEVAKLAEAIATLNGALSVFQSSEPAANLDQSGQIKSLKAEIAALRAAREEEVAELADITAALIPLIEEAEAHA